jgi:starvation-inducible DNA-binding protein
MNDNKNDNKKVAQAMREAHKVCDDHGDIASASLIENWID